MNKAFLVSLVAIFSVLTLIATVIATGSLNIDLKDVKVDGVSVLPSDDPASTPITVDAGATIPIKVTFKALQNASDIRVKAEIVGDRDEISSKTERFQILTAGGIYTKTFTLKVPYDVDPYEEYTLSISVFNKDKSYEESYTLNVQRASYNVDVLSADFDREVEAGSNLDIDIVIKNKGFERLDDLYVIARISELGVEKRAYFEDLTPLDDENKDRYDSEERSISLKIPASAEEGTYNVEVIAYNADTEEKVSKSVAVIGTKAISQVIVPVTTKEIVSGETKTFDFVVVNRGKSLGVYEIVPESVENLVVSVDKSIVTVASDSSASISMQVKAGDKKGTYNFAVNVMSEGQVVKKVNLTANVVSGSAGIAPGITKGNITILTVVLGIIFIVLLIVLIVLLTRKPAKEEVEESYY